MRSKVAKRLRKQAQIVLGRDSNKTDYNKMMYKHYKKIYKNLRRNML